MARAHHAATGPPRQDCYSPDRVARPPGPCHRYRSTGAVSGLPWVRLDTGIASHDKTLALLADPSPKRWQAMSSYMFGLSWSGDHGTDGQIPATALPFIHGTKTTAALLVKYEFWEPAGTGWQIRNYATRQELAVITAGKKEAKRIGAAKGNCVRWHGPDCGCWQREVA